MSASTPSSPAKSPAPPLISVVAVNYNSLKWFDRFFSSLEQQTVFNRMEVVVVDNTSNDGSAEFSRSKLASWPNGVFVPTGGNYGFGGGCNRGAKAARGKYLLFLNPDVWFEKNCFEELVSRAEAGKIRIGFPLILDYDTDAVQTKGSVGFDLFGNVIPENLDNNPVQLFSVGAFFFIEHAFFDELGGFDEEFFLYSEEMDLSWRAWIAGEPVWWMSTARLHHQAASAGDRFVENRTNEMRRFYSNRNQMLTILKNARGPLLALLFTQIAFITAEAVVGMVISRRLSFVRWALFKPLADCWRLRSHIIEQRKRNRALRRHGDLWFLRRFFRFKFGRMSDLKSLFRSRIKIDPAK